MIYLVFQVSSDSFTFFNVLDANNIFVTIPFSQNTQNILSWWGGEVLALVTALAQIVGKILHTTNIRFDDFN